MNLVPESAATDDGEHGWDGGRRFQVGDHRLVARCHCGERVLYDYLDGKAPIDMVQAFADHVAEMAAAGPLAAAC